MAVLASDIRTGFTTTRRIASTKLEGKVAGLSPFALGLVGKRAVRTRVVALDVGADGGASFL